MRLSKSRWQLGMFDWDGSLCDSLPVVYRAVVEIFRTFSPSITPPSLEEYRNGVTSDFKEFYYSHGIERTVTGDDINRVWKEYMDKQTSGGLLNPGARELLMLCRELDIPLAIVSANPESDQKFSEILRELNILSYFDHIRLRAWPKETALLEMLDFVGAQAEKSFYFDDTFDGITSAKGLGIQTIGHTGGYNSRRRIAEAAPDFTAHSLREAADIIATIGKR